MSSFRSTTRLRRVSRSLLTVAAREVYEQARARVVWSIMLFAVLITAIATRTGFQQFDSRRQTYDAFAAQRTADADRAGGRLSGWQVERSLRAIRLPSITVAVVTGWDLSVPAYWDFGPAGIRTGPPPVAAADASRPVDLEFVFRVAIGLLAIILATEALAAERASGVLLALLGQPISPMTVLGGKLLGGAITTGAAIFIVLITAYTGIEMLTAGSSPPGLLGCLAALGAAAWLYSFTFFSLGLLISSYAASYRVALAAGIVCWLVIGLAGPSIPSLVARSVAATPPMAIMESEADRVFERETRQVQLTLGNSYLLDVPAGEDWKAFDRQPELRRKTLERLNPIWVAGIKAVRNELEARMMSRQIIVARQRRIEYWLALLSPGAQLTRAVTDLTGTGEASARRWESAVSGYQQVINRLLFDDPPRLTLLVPGEPRVGPEQGGRWIVTLSRRPPVELRALPQFSEPDGRFTTRLKDGAPSLGLLFLDALLLTTAASFGFKRVGP